MQLRFGDKVVQVVGIYIILEIDANRNGMIFGKVEFYF